MTVTSTTLSLKGGVPEAPIALCRLLQAFEGDGAVFSDLAPLLRSDSESATLFLRLARATLPGRKSADPGDYLSPLGSDRATRMLILASGTLWLQRLVGDRALSAALTRHSIATAVVTEPLCRDLTLPQARAAFAAALLHHLGDAVALSVRTFGDSTLKTDERAQLTHQLVLGAGAPTTFAGTFLEAIRHDTGVDQKLSRETEILSMADQLVTGFGYGVPAVCLPPRPEGPASDIARNLANSPRRICRLIEDVVSVLTGAQFRDGEGVGGSAGATSFPRNIDAIVSLFSKVDMAGDRQSVIRAGTAALVDVLGLSRALFLEARNGIATQGGMLCVQGSAPTMLSVEEVGDVPDAAHRALQAGEPIFSTSGKADFEHLGMKGPSPLLYVPVGTRSESMGVFGVEVGESTSLLPELLTSFAAHFALALKAAELQRLTSEARRDELTGMYNRRGILDLLDRNLEDLRADDDLSIALIDCDQLKKVNDNFGHQMGDVFVRRISEVLMQVLRNTDELGRYGGDEFLAVLPHTTLEHAEMIMKRARERVELAGFASEDGLLLSVSIGAVVRGNSKMSREELLKLADHALYRAKQAGRNAVQIINAESPPELSL